MTRKTKHFFIILISLIVLLIFIFGISIFMGFVYFNYEQPFKETLTLCISLGSILGTLGAAIVAGYLFNDWRDQHNKSVRNQFSIEVYNKFSEFEQSITLCASAIDSLQVSISDAQYHITPGIPRYDECFPAIEKIFEKLNLVQLNFSNYLNTQRAYGAVTGQMSKIKESLGIYVADFSGISKNNLNTFENVQELVNKTTEEIKQYTDLSLKIYELSINEILVSLQVEE